MQYLATNQNCMPWRVKNDVIIKDFYLGADEVYGIIGDDLTFGFNVRMFNEPYFKCVNNVFSYSYSYMGDKITLIELLAYLKYE